MRSVTSNRPLRELVAEAKAEVMEEIEDNREEGEEDDVMELTVVTNLVFFSFSSVIIPFLKTLLYAAGVTKQQRWHSKLWNNMSITIILPSLLHGG